MKIFLCLAALVAVHAAPPMQKPLVPGQYMVFLKPGVAQSAISSLLNRVTVNNAMVTPDNKEFLLLQNVPPHMVRLFQENPLVEFIEQDSIQYLDAFDLNVEATATMPHTPYVETVTPDQCVEMEGPFHGSPNIWHMIRSTQRERDENDVHRANYHGTSADIYILDTGVEVEHEEFNGRAINFFIANNIDPQDPQDRNGHGTHCAGLAGGYTYGAARNSVILNVKIMGDNGSGLTSGIMAGIVASHQRANDHPERTSILSMSFGGGTTGPAWEQVIDNAIDSGHIVVASAGNNGGDTREVFPAGQETVIAVGVTESNDRLAAWSNWGPANDVNAPGVTVWAAGSTHTAACSGHEPMRCLRASSGTSMSTPFVGGILGRHRSPNQQAARVWLHTAGSVHGKLTLIGEHQESTPNRLVHLNDC